MGTVTRHGTLVLYVGTGYDLVVMTGERRSLIEKKLIWNLLAGPEFNFMNTLLVAEKLVSLLAFCLH